MIKNSILYYGMPQTGKSTLLMRIAIKDLQKHQHDLVINMWTFLHKDFKHAKVATLPFISTPHGRVRALRLPYNPYQWLKTLSIFHQQIPHVAHIMIDEAYCINPVLLVTLTMIIRDFYPKAPIIFTSIDYDSWHHKLPQINDLIRLTPKHKHLNHQCIFCHRIAERRLHVINEHPIYNEKKYNNMLIHHSWTKNGHPMMFSVCEKHYLNPPHDLKQAIKRNEAKYQPKTPQQQAQMLRKSLGLNKNVQISFKKNK